MKEKYIEERFRPWFIFGTDIADAGGDITDKKELCEKHNQVVAELARMAIAWAESDQEAFNKYWYPQSVQ